MHDVLIIGAGPAGLYLARRLALDGFDVVVLEEHDLVGTPVHCTGIVAAEAFEEFDLSRQCILNPLTSVRFFSPAGREFKYTTPGVQALVIDRAFFDQQLAIEARAAGVNLAINTGVTDVVINSDSAVVTAVNKMTRENIIFRGRACVLACGADYRFHRRLGLEIPANFLQSAQAEVPALPLEDVELHFGRDIAPGGFAWIVPVRRLDQTYIRVGLMCDRRAGDYFQKFVKNVQSRRWPDQVFKRPRRKILPLGPIPKTFGSRLIAAGDAAGIVKPTTGGGIYTSVLSAALAADVLTKALRGDDLREVTLSQYELFWKQKLDSEFKAQSSLRNLAQRLSDDDIESLLGLARTDGILPMVRRTLRFNQHREFIWELLKHQQARAVLLG